MKKCLVFSVWCLVFSVWCLVPCYADAPYSFCKLTGDVQYRSRYTNSQWKEAELHQSAENADSVFIPENGALAIVHRSSGQVFYSLSSGKKRVYDVVKEAREQSGRTVRLLINQMKEQSQTQDPSPTYAMVGATTRAEEEDITLEDSLSSCLNEWAYRMLLGEDLPYVGQIEVQSTETGDEFYLTFVNHSEQGRYVNVLYIDEQEQKIGLLYHHFSQYSPYLYVAAGERLELSMYLFWLGAQGGSGNKRYIIFSSERAFDANRLQSLLQYELIQHNEISPIDGIDIHPFPVEKLNHTSITPS